MYKISANESTAIYAKTESAEVLSISKNSALVQGEGVVDFYVLSNGTERIVKADFSENATKTIHF